MSDRIDSAAARRAAAARAAAAERRRREAEAAAARAKAAAEAAEAAARAKAAAAVRPDELSTGVGSAIARRGRAVTGADGLPAQLSSDAPVVSTRDVQRAPRYGSADAAEAHLDEGTVAGAALPASYGSPDSLERAGAEEAEAELIAAAAEDFETAVNEETPLEAAEHLSEALESLEPEQRGDFLAESAESIEQLTENITDLDRDETADVVRELAHAADIAGPAHVEELTGPLARAIADGRLEQTGDSADGGPGGIFQGANTHNSEREFIDGIADLGDAPGGALFRDALASSLSTESQASSGDRADRALGFAGAVITGESEHVPDDGVWTQVRELGSDVVGLVEDAVQRVQDLREGLADRALDSILGITESLESLEPGDTLTIGASGAVSVELHGQFENQLQVTRNEDGTYTVAGSSSVLGGVGAAGNKLAVGGGGVVEFTFDNLEEAIDGTQALSKIALSSTLPVIAGLAFPSPDELVNLGQSISAVQVNSEAAVGLNARFGLTGLQGGGAEGGLQASQGARIEFENGLPSAVVARYEISGDAAAEASNLVQRFANGAIPDGVISEFEDRFGFNPLDIQGVAEVAGSLTIEVRTPIETSPVEGGNPLEQVAELIANPEEIIGGAPTATVTLQGEAEAEGAGIAGSVTIDGLDSGEIGTFVTRLQEGDLEGAIAGTGATTTFSYNTYEDVERGWLNHGLDIAVASVNGQNVVRHNDETHETVLRPNADGTRLVVA
mgnify:CR=1 FL=1